MNKYIIFLMLFLLTTLSLINSASASTTQNPIYESVSLLNTRLDKKTALTITQAIIKYSKKYRLDPFLVVSIARAESGLTPDKIRVVTSKVGVEKNRDGKFVVPYEVTDFCLMQIHKTNVTTLNLDPNKLLSSPDYCVHEGVKILLYFKGVNGNSIFWWTSYNAIDPEKKEVYKRDVLKFYNMVRGGIPTFSKVVVAYTGQPPPKEYFL